MSTQHLFGWSRRAALSCCTGDCIEMTLLTQLLCFAHDPHLNAVISGGPPVLQQGY